MNEKLFLEGVDLLLEETAMIILKRNILGDPVFTGSVNSNKEKKETALKELPKPILSKIIKQLEKNNPKVTDIKSLESFVRKQPKPIRFSMIGKTFRLVNDGSEKQSKSMSDIAVRAKYGKA